MYSLPGFIAEKSREKSTLHLKIKIHFLTFVSPPLPSKFSKIIYRGRELNVYNRQVHYGKPQENPYI